MAASQLGSFSYDMLLNIAKFEDGLTKAEALAQRHAQTIQKSLSGAIDSVSDGLKDIAGLLAGGLGLEKLAEIADQSLKSAQQTENFSRILGVTTQTLQAFGYAAGVVGGNLEETIGWLTKMERAGEQAAAGNLQTAEAFRALGISAAQLPGLLKDPSQLLLTLSKNIAELGDGTGRTAAIMQIFGRGGSSILPFLIELGEHFDQVQQRARAFGVVLTDEDQAALYKTNEALDTLKEAAIGAGNQFTIAMLPAINAVVDALERFAEGGGIRDFFSTLGTDIGQFVTVLGQVKDDLGIVREVFGDMAGSSGQAIDGMSHDLVGYIQQSLNEFSQLKGFVEQVWVTIKAEAATEWADVENIVLGVINDISVAFARMLANAGDFAKLSGDIGLGLQFDAAAVSVANFANSLQPVTADLTGYRNQIIDIQTQTNTEIAANNQWAQSTRLTSDALAAMTLGLEEFQASLKSGDIAGNAQKLAQAQQNIREGAEQLIAAGADATKVYHDESSALDSLTTMVGRADAAQVNYDAKVKAGSQAANAYANDLKNLGNLEEQLASGLGGPYLAALKAYQKETDLLAKTWADAVAAGKGGKELDALIVRLSKDGEDAAVAYAKTTAQIKLQHDQFAPLIADLQLQETLLHTAPQDQAAVTAAMNAYNTALKANVDLYGDAIPEGEKITDVLNRQLPAWTAEKQHVDDVTAAVKNNNQVMKDWQNIAVQGFDSVGKTIADFATGGIKKWSDFGKALVTDAKQFIAQIIEEFLKLNFFNGIINNLFNLTGTSALATGGGGLFGAALGTGGGISSLLNWTTGADGTTGAGATTNGGLFGTAEGGLSLFNAGKTMFSGFSSGISNLFLGSGSGGSSFLGSSIGGDFGSTFAPSALGYGLAGAGGLYAGFNEFQNAGGGAAGLAGGAAYGVGSAAIGLGVASAATGGGLIAGLSVLGPVGWAGIALMAVDMLSGGKLFGTKGSFNFGQQAITVGAGGATVSAGYDLKGQSALFGGSTHSWQTLPADPAAQAAADQFFAQLKNGTDAFAKQFGVTMGDVVGGQFVSTFDKKGNVTKTQSTVLGQTYNDTQAQFGERLQAENELAVLDTFDSKLNASIDQYRANADQLIAITSALANGETMMKAGTSFLALGTDQSLSSLLKLAQGSQAFGESIDQTLARIEQAQAAYDQFVGQFKPAANYVDDFEKALSGINAQMVANVKQANALAIAAGAQGAAEKDLANIHKYAAAQVQLAITALEQSAQALAFSMGLSTVGTLDQVNSEIQQLESQAKSGASGIQNFGNAITQVSQKATAAMNLLLGDLSPLNDQQKLQDALQGLRAGTATQEEVLQIGRRLYASSQAYTDLFNMVKNMGHAAATGGGGGGVAVGGLSASDQQKLAELQKEQTQLLAAQDYTNAQTLAQQIAEIAAAKSEDYKKVATDMHIDLGALEKKLGLNDDSFAKLIASDQAAKDSNGDNTTSIVDVLNKILLALGGTPDAGTPAGGPPSTPPGHAGPRSGMTVQQFVDQVVGGLINRGPRNMRPQRA